MNLLLGAYNIFSTPWLQSFYPDDLPADWRIEYYANEFDLIHIPVGFWQEKSFDPLEEPWPQNLSMVLEVVPALTRSTRWEAIESWAEQQDNLIATVTPETNCLGNIHQIRMLQDNQSLHPASPENPELLILHPEQFDLKAVKTEIDKLVESTTGENTYLILDASPGELDKTRTLIELMGL